MLCAGIGAPPSGVRAQDCISISIEFSVMDDVGDITCIRIVSLPLNVKAVRSGSRVMAYLSGSTVVGIKIAVYSCIVPLGAWCLGAV